MVQFYFVWPVLLIATFAFFGCFTPAESGEPRYYLKDGGKTICKCDNYGKGEVCNTNYSVDKRVPYCHPSLMFRMECGICGCLDDGTAKCTC